MGRIEEAVKKLQRQGLPPRSRLQSEASEQARLGTIRTRKLDYEGKFIEVDYEQLRANELLAPDFDERRLAEQYRAIKRPLLRNASNQGEAGTARGNLLMVASALSGEGKTFTCVNLCLSMAREKDWSIVLVDADCSKPHLTRLFSAEEEPGLLDLLRDPDADFESFVMPTDISGFSLMPAGTVGTDASELLASRRMDSLCNTISANNPSRLVVFDTSPLLLTTEAVALSAHVGQIAFVVRANSTPKHAVLAALEELDPKKAIGCILNQAYGAGHGSLQPYGYGNEAYGT